MLGMLCPVSLARPSAMPFDTKADIELISLHESRQCFTSPVVAALMS